MVVNRSVETDNHQVWLSGRCAADAVTAMVKTNVVVEDRDREDDRCQQ
jgi:hypothetical protein